MIIIPEIETVVILVPRTGTGSLSEAIKLRYPKAMMLYRHMEADGVPHGYDRWRRVGVCREPIARLWSLYKFMGAYPREPAGGPDYVEALRDSVQRPFDEWIMHNQVVFTCPYDSGNKGRFWPRYMVNHSLPENRKTQWLYLRPDLGTEVFPYLRLDDLAASLDISMHFRVNETDRSKIRPSVDGEAAEYVQRVFTWDIEASAA